MGRVGPNQDINDLTVLENLRLLVEEVSVRANDHNNAHLGITEIKSQGIKVNESNTRFIPITTLLQKKDGSNLEITGFTASGTFKQENLNEYLDSIINTYINQAERFRGYYDDIISTIDFWSDRDNGSIITTSFLTSQTTISGLPSGEHQGFAETNMGLVQKDGYAVVDQSEIPISINWSGNGPTNYNSGTYPQLTSIFNNLQTILSIQDQPFLDIYELIPDFYDGASSIDGFSKTLDLFERTDWDSDKQKFAQTSGRLISQNALDSPISIVGNSILSIPIMVSNFTSSSQILAYSVKVTITPRNSSNRIFSSSDNGFVYKNITLYTSPVTSEVKSITHNGSNTSEVNDMLTDTFELQGTDTIFIAANTISVREILIAFVNQLKITNGPFPDWDTEDLLSDINIQVNLDGKTINKNFISGITRDMWV